MDPISIHWPAVLAAAVVRMAIGALWYSPLMFVRAWQALTGVTDEMMRARFGRAIAIDAAMSLLMAFALANIIGASRIHDWANGAGAGIWVGIGFIATTFVPLWAYESRPIGLVGLNVGFNVASLAVMGALLGAWR